MSAQSGRLVPSPQEESPPSKSGERRGAGPGAKPAGTSASPPGLTHSANRVGCGSLVLGKPQAASLAGEMTRVWARAQRLCPPVRKANGSWRLVVMQQSSATHIGRSAGLGSEELPTSPDSPFQHPNLHPPCNGWGPGSREEVMALEPTFGDTAHPRAGPGVGSDSPPSGAQQSPEPRWPPRRMGWSPPGRPVRAS